MCLRRLDAEPFELVVAGDEVLVAGEARVGFHQIGLGRWRHNAVQASAGQRGAERTGTGAVHGAHRAGQGDAGRASHAGAGRHRFDGGVRAPDSAVCCAAGVRAHVLAQAEAGWTGAARAVHRSDGVVVHLPGVDDDGAVAGDAAAGGAYGLDDGRVAPGALLLHRRAVQHRGAEAAGVDEGVGARQPGAGIAHLCTLAAVDGPGVVDEEIATGGDLAVVVVEQRPELQIGGAARADRRCRADAFGQAGLRNGLVRLALHLDRKHVPVGDIPVRYIGQAVKR